MFSRYSVRTGIKTIHWRCFFFSFSFFYFFSIYFYCKKFIIFMYLLNLVVRRFFFVVSFDYNVQVIQINLFFIELYQNLRLFHISLKHFVALIFTLKFSYWKENWLFDKERIRLITKSETSHVIQIFSVNKSIWAVYDWLYENRPVHMDWERKQQFQFDRIQIKKVHEMVPNWN